MARPVPEYLENLPDVSNITWNSNSWFKYGTFGGFHEMAGDALRGIFPGADNFGGITLNPEDLLDIDSSKLNGDEFIRANTSAIIYSAFALIFALFLLVLGIIWCVGRICCTCNWLKKKTVNSEFVQNRFGQSRQAEHDPTFVPNSKKPSKLKLGLGILLLSLMVVYMTFLIGLFVTNGQLKSSIGELSNDLDAGLEDGETYIDLTKRQIDAVMKTSYLNMSHEVGIIAGCVPDPSGLQAPTFLENQMRILSKLDDSVTDLLGILNTTNIPSALQSVITKKESFAQSLKPLTPNQTPLDTCADLVTIQGELEENADDINAALDSIPIPGVRNDLEAIESDFEFAESAIFYPVTVLNVILLAILLVLVTGTVLLMLKPKNKIGSFSLNCGLFAIFILGWMIWIFSIVIFFFSGILVVIIPGAFENVASNGSLVNPDARNAGDPYVVPSTAHILQTCKNSESAYVVFKLEKVYNVSDLNDLIDILVPTAPRNVEIFKNVDINISQLENELHGHNVTRNQLIEIDTLFAELDSNFEKRISDVAALRNQVTKYVEFAQEEIEKKIGNCKPLYDVLESTLHTFSYKLGSPIGTYWLSLTLILFLLFPIVLTSVIFLRQ